MDNYLIWTYHGESHLATRSQDTMSPQVVSQNNEAAAGHSSDNYSMMDDGVGPAGEANCASVQCHQDENDQAAHEEEEDDEDFLEDMLCHTASDFF
jgi:hypothetical protein